MRAGVYRVPTDYRVQRPPPPMSDLHRSFIVSIEKFSINLAATETSKQTALTMGQVLRKCAPWPMQRRLNGQVPNNYFLNVKFESPDKVTVSRNDGTGSVDIEVAVVEYGNGVSVQQKTFNSGVKDIDVTVDAVDQAKTFAMAHYESDDTNARFDLNLRRVHFTSDTNVRLRVEPGGGATHDGNLYVLEDVRGDLFDVDAVDMTLGVAATSVTGAIGAVVDHKTFMVCTSSTDDGGTAVAAVNSIVFNLNTDTEVQAQAKTAGFTQLLTAFVIELLQPDALIQRGVVDFSDGGSSITRTVALAPVDPDVAIPWIPAMRSNCRWENASNPEMSGCFVTGHFDGTPGDQITLNAGQAESDRGLCFWEVIEFTGAEIGPDPRQSHRRIFGHVFSRVN